MSPDINTFLFTFCIHVSAAEPGMSNSIITTISYCPYKKYVNSWLQATGKCKTPIWR